MSLHKKLAWALGYELRRIRKGNTHAAMTERLIRDSQPDIIFDVGANAGQFGQATLSLRRDAHLVSFEPLSEAHADLTERAKDYPHWTVAPRMAVGAQEGEVEINVSEFSQSSSILANTSRNLSAFPMVRSTGTEKVPVHRLDNIVADYVQPGQRIYLKSDTQGYEKQVLEGATGIWDSIVGLQMELQTVELYEGSPLMEEMLDYVLSRGLRLHGLANGARDAQTREMVEFDAYFIRV